MSKGQAVDWDEEFDVVSVGSGCGGLAAAITAQHSGSTALVLEKAPRLGGVTARSAGQVWAGGTHLEQQAKIADSVEETYDYLTSISAGLGDAELRRSLVERMVEAIRFMDEHSDLQLTLIRHYPDYYYPVAEGAKSDGRYMEVAPFDVRELGELAGLLEVSPHGLANATDVERTEAVGNLESLEAAMKKHAENHEVCSGSGLSGRLVRGAQRLGATMRVDHEVTGLITEEGRVTGVEVSTPEGTRRIKARGVVLATGGYDWNEKLVGAYNHTELRSMTSPAITGDHITMGGAVGAMVTGRPNVLTPLMLGMHVPGMEVDGHPLYLYVFAGQPHVILVNKAGERFADESFYPSVDAGMDHVDGPTAQYVNRSTWLVCDQNFRDKYPVGPFYPGQDLPDGLAIVADSPRELAERAGFDPDNFERTLEKFNKAAAEGVDPEFGRGERPWSVFAFGDKSYPCPVMGPLEKMPLYAIELARVGVGIPSVGLQIDDIGRVINTQGQAIPGLYAAGNAAAPIDVPGYQSGLANSRGLTYGHYSALDILGADVAVNRS